MGDSMKDQPRSGRPRVTSSRQDRILRRLCMKDRRKTAVELRKEWVDMTGKDVSPRTVRRRLVQGGLRSRKARRKPLISPDQKKKRLAWARSHKDWSQRQWDKVLWSDESSFQLFSTPGNVRVRRKPHEQWKQECIVPTVKHGGSSVLVWACMTSSGVGNLVAVDGILNSRKYQTLLADNLLPSARKLFRNGRNFIFQQDNAPCHTSKSSIRWFQDNNVSLLDWPAQSPDMSPIENLWQDLKEAVRRRRPTNKGQLKTVLFEEWDKIRPERCQTLVASMPARTAALCAAKGLFTKY